VIRFNPALDSRDPSSAFANSFNAVLRSQIGTEHRFPVEILVHILSCLYVPVPIKPLDLLDHFGEPSSPISL